jgi:acyl-CoA thioester hydrolase
MTDSPANPIYNYTFTVPAEALDQNGHVNNVHYVQWMQEAAVRHYEHMGGVPSTQAIGATWVVRSHHVEFLAPAYAGDLIEVRTWVANLRRVRSLRKYEFVRVSEGVTLVRGETDWVLVDIESGRPVAIPEAIKGIFIMMPDPRH